MLGAIRSDGGRITSARRAVATVLVADRAHLTAEEIAALVQRTQPDVHQATIYRTLDEFERLGLVTHVHLRHGPAVFHLADRPHHHLVCESCDEVVEVPAKELASLRRKLDRDYGFAVDSAHFAITGWCAACREQRD
ncbi:MAG: Fur family transcriptional regulator, ferric uptake regulator [Acidimicrobiaceae bacterium]|jgi:Fur family ferric uptake transcriptional regulator|nr:Fur family transcriptional regulator, ferric uptake regulator [Acidimicrobiaceae bacterium]